MSSYEQRWRLERDAMGGGVICRHVDSKAMDLVTWSPKLKTFLIFQLKLSRIERSVPEVQRLVCLIACPKKT